MKNLAKRLKGLCVAIVATVLVFAILCCSVGCGGNGYAPGDNIPLDSEAGAKAIEAIETTVADSNDFTGALTLSAKKGNNLILGINNGALKIAPDDTYGFDMQISATAEISAALLASFPSLVPSDSPVSLPALSLPTNLTVQMPIAYYLVDGKLYTMVNDASVEMVIPGLGDNTSSIDFGGIKDFIAGLGDANSDSDPDNTMDTPTEKNGFFDNATITATENGCELMANYSFADTLNDVLVVAKDALSDTNTLNELAVKYLDVDLKTILSTVLGTYKGTDSAKTAYDAIITALTTAGLTQADIDKALALIDKITKLDVSALIDGLSNYTLNALISELSDGLLNYASLVTTLVSWLDSTLPDIIDILIDKSELPSTASDTVATILATIATLDVDKFDISATATFNKETNLTGLTATADIAFTVGTDSYSLAVSLVLSDFGTTTVALPA